MRTLRPSVLPDNRKLVLYPLVIGLSVAATGVILGNPVVIVLPLTICDDAKRDTNLVAIGVSDNPVRSSDRKKRMRKLNGCQGAAKTALVLLLILGVTLPGFSAVSDEERLMGAAKDLYNAGEYIVAIEVLETVEPRTAEVIYWLWANEKKIGRLADPGSRDSASPQHKYYLYAQSHPEYLRYDESFGGQYIPTRKRYEEIHDLFPQSEYAGLILFELIDYDRAAFSEGGLDEQGRMSLISMYQKFLNRYPQHPYVPKAKQEIESLEKWKEKADGLGVKVKDESMLLPYEEKFNVDQQLYHLYVNEWLGSGWFREYPIQLMVGTTRLDDFNIPGSAKKGIQNLLEGGNLIVMSEAAFQNRDWQGPKFLVFEPKK